MRKTKACNGKKLAQIRHEQGLTQNDVARKAGYSERLIRKAEAGGEISYTAMRDIATALNTESFLLSAEDLMVNYEQLARQFLELASTISANSIEQAYLLGAHVTNDVEVFCAGDPATIPFAGKHSGIDGLSQWLKLVSNFRLQMRLQNADFYSCDNTVVAWCFNPVCVAGRHYPPICTCQRFYFQETKLVRYEILPDTEKLGQYLRQLNPPMPTECLNPVARTFQPCNDYY